HCLGRLGDRPSPPGRSHRVLRGRRRAGLGDPRASGHGGGSDGPAPDRAGPSPLRTALRPRTSRGSRRSTGCACRPASGCAAAGALALLRTMTGDAGAQFRPGQLETIQAIVEQRRRALVVQRTGWGKSAVYLSATKLLRDAGSGPTLLFSPLLALMRNQLEMAHRAGVNAGTINSANTEEWPGVQEQVRQGSIDLLLVSPARLNHPDFREGLLPVLVRTTGLVVVDEAHCISDWDH